MNITLPKDTLATLIQTASRPIPTRSTIPSIRGCLIEATSAGVTFSGTNLDWGVRVFAKAKVQSPGSLVVSSRMLEDVVRTLSEPEATLSLPPSAWALSVKSGSSEIVLNAVPGDDFPHWPEEPMGDEIVLKGDLFKEMIRIGATCAVTNPARPLWGACLLEFTKERMAVVSTDQFALSRALTKASGSEVSAIVSATVLSEIARLTDDKDEVKIKISENHIYFTTPSISCFSRLIEGQYYAYGQVIPKKFVTEVTAPTEELLRAASRAAIVSSEEDRAMRIIVDGEGSCLTVKAGSAEKGKMEEAIPADIQGEDLEIWVQHKYVLQALSKISAEKIFLGISGDVSPIKVTPIFPEEEMPAVDETFVIMPMSSPRGEY